MLRGRFANAFDHSCKEVGNAIVALCEYLAPIVAEFEASHWHGARDRLATVYNRALDTCEQLAAACEALTPMEMDDPRIAEQVGNGARAVSDGLREVLSYEVGLLAPELTDWTLFSSSHLGELTSRIESLSNAVPRFLADSAAWLEHLDNPIGWVTQASQEATRDLQALLSYLGEHTGTVDEDGEDSILDAALAGLLTLPEDEFVAALNADVNKLDALTDAALVTITAVE